ncbi:RsmB/NOP family class I SAM-dependent RNA methyltransferase [Ignicoccus hospitalis]|uniref:RsmB/NOP family class I SAM-dependent RNA methyltransferase n=1 Tax=Ignicoccus hospitalis TaxID=160233 RepID=UPI000699104C|nr:RsmB/NOP family class I SAM-dependent RNA methyltransferase [Ignicoccus hospitalis]HIH91038.1 RsmB/NOP family class I SAM-dependent RNA methyltransferase [Desulfurococcaceae archaeon]
MRTAYPADGRFSYGKRILEELGEQFDLPELFEALRTPGKRLCARVNLLRGSPEEVLEELERTGYEPETPYPYEELVCVRVEGPFEVPLTDAVVVADKRAAESVLMGADLYAPGLLEAKGVKAGEPVTVLAEKTLEPVGFGRALFEGEPPRRGKVVETVVTKFKAPKFRELKSFEKGLIYPQSAPAVAAVRALEPEGLVVDMNAAPGGKAFHAYELLRGKGKVIAFDISKKRISKMMEEMRRLGHSFEVVRADSRYLDLDFPHLVGKADRVIVDPPCTAIGVIPKVWDVKKDEDMINAFEYQKQFVKVAYKLLKKGGLMLYSTCTLTKTENERVVEFAEEMGFEVVEKDTPWGKTPVKVSPSVHGEPGFFIAILKKK